MNDVEINISDWIKHPIELLEGSINPITDTYYDFLPEYDSFNEKIYYDLLNSFDKNQLRTFYLNLYIYWNNYLKIDLENKKRIKTISEVNLNDLNTILKEFIQKDKIYGIVIINIIQKQLLG